MAPNSLSPASVVIAYHTAFSSHRMTIPTRDWNPVPVGGSIGSYEDWLGNPRDAEDMVTDLVTDLLPFFLPSTTFDEVTVYTMASPTSPNIPRANLALGLVGTSTGTGQSAAVSASFMFKTMGNHDSKLVCLDIPIGSNWFSPLLPADFTPDILALEVEFTNGTNAWSGRDDTQPNILRKVTFDLNDKLQKLYWG